MSKKFFAILTILVIVFGISSSFIFAKNDKEARDIPEKDGTYDVPGHPEMKVRVFVYKVKPEKPGKPTPPLPSIECGLLDLDSTTTVRSAGWKLPSDWTYNLNPNNVPALVGSGNWPLIAENSFSTWESEVSNKVDIIKGEETNISKYGLDGVNLIAWGRASATTLGVTYIWYYTNSGEVVEIDTIMNKKFVWAWSDSDVCAYTDSYDAQNILTHELGHWFGLDDHYTNDYQNNTMYGYGSKMEVKKNTLTTGDIDGVQAIYGN